MRHGGLEAFRRAAVSGTRDESEQVMAMSSRKRRGSAAPGDATPKVVEPIWSSATVALPKEAGRRFAIARHRMLAAACRIAADCERMLDGLDRPGRDLWRDAVGEVLLASRRLIARIERVAPPGDGPGLRRQLTQLRHEVREPQRRILDATRTLLGLVPTGPDDELLVQDARGIRQLAISLLADAGMTDSGVSGRPSSGRGRIATEQPEIRAPKLLVVDDEPAPRRALSRLLKRLVYEVQVAEHGRAALALAEAQAFDLILTDITMPELDGLELLRRLKADDRTRDVPVIVVSGVGDTESVVRCIEQGAEDHVIKPYEVVLLQARIRASLERKRNRDLELADLERVGQLTAAAEAVERTAYEPGSLDALGRRDDALGRLARVFDRMVSGIRSREERLQRRLGQLRHEMQQAREGAASTVTGVSGDSPFVVGDLVAERYEIVGELGRGGMGMVYRARDRELGEDIALKVVRRDLVGFDPSIVERLKSEIRLARRISHRNVVRAHDLGEWRGVHFLTMEYVRGITVDALLNTRGALSVESTLAIGTQLAEALTVAHDQQIIHRDIKPANLLLEETGTLKVMDFGLARVAEKGGGLTLAGFVVGTPGYMSPEQHLGGAVDARSDLFSTGVVLYECLTGRPPFDASSPKAVVDQVLAGRATPIRELLPGIPPALAALVDRLLQHDPADRLASARELAEQLGQIGQVSG